MRIARWLHCVLRVWFYRSRFLFNRSHWRGRRPASLNHGRGDGLWRKCIVPFGGLCIGRKLGREWRRHGTLLGRRGTRNRGDLRLQPFQLFVLTLIVLLNCCHLLLCVIAEEYPHHHKIELLLNGIHVRLSLSA